MSMWTAVSFTLLIVSIAYLLYNMVVGMRTAHERGQNPTKEFGLSLILLTLFFNAWISQALAEWQEFASEQLAHGRTVSWADFLPRFITSTASNHQSEYLQLWALVTLSARHIHKGSTESKDSDEQMKADLAAVHTKLDRTQEQLEGVLAAMERKSGPNPGPLSSLVRVFRKYGRN